MSDLTGVTVRRVLRWPLRVIGLDPGRALANANPSQAQRGHDREVLRTLITQKSRPPDAGRFPARRHRNPRR